LIATILSLGQCTWLLSPHRSLWPGILIGQVLIALLAWLLSTTPQDAIKLRRITSEFVIFVIVAILQYCMGWNYWIAPAALILAAILLAAARRTRISPWWAALIVWNPLLSIASTLAIHAPG
jgi:hypothetical protein